MGSCVGGAGNHYGYYDQSKMNVYEARLQASTLNNQLNEYKRQKFISSELNKQKSIESLMTRVTPISMEEFEKIKQEAKGKSRYEQPILVELQPKENWWSKIKNNRWVKQILKELVYK